MEGAHGEDHEENDWDHITKVDVVEGPIERVTRAEMVKTIGEMKPGKVAGPSEVSVERLGFV